MDERLIAALEDCRARLARGEPLALCLAAHPEHAAELRPLLATLLHLRALRHEPDAAFAAASRARFHSRLAKAQAAQRAPRAARRPLRWLRRLALPAAAAAVLISSGFGLVTASADALPNSPLYKVQQAHEQVAGYLARTPEAQTAYHLRLANQRLQQLKYAHAVDAGPAVVDELTAGMVQQTSLAAQSWATLPPAQQAKLAPKVAPLLKQEHAALQWEAAHEPPRVAEHAAQREAQLRATAERLLAAESSAPTGEAATPPAGAHATPGAQYLQFAEGAQHTAASPTGGAAATKRTAAPPAPAATPNPAVQPSGRLTPAERLRRLLVERWLRQHAPPPVQTPHS